MLGESEVIEETVALDTANLESLRYQLKESFVQVKLIAFMFCYCRLFSASMGLHQDSQTGRMKVGNDPQFNESCGRLEAIHALIDMVNSQRADEDEVKFALVPFAGEVLKDRMIEFEDMAQFREKMDANSVCSYLVQSEAFETHPQNPGGIWAGNRISPSTNYKAAFDKARSFSNEFHPAKVVYMISDGLPTSGGNDPVQSSIEAGENYGKTV